MTTLIKPVITEKSMSLAARGVFTFLVERGVNKHQIKEAVERLFGVSVTGVNTTVIHTATARTGKLRLRKHSPSRKFARVALKSGQTIALFDLKEDK